MYLTTPTGQGGVDANVHAASWKHSRRIWAGLLTPSFSTRQCSLWTSTTARTACRTSLMLLKTWPWMAWSLSVRLQRSATPLVWGSSMKARDGARPQKRIWFREVVGQVLGAVIHAQRDPARDVPAHGPEDLLDSHTERLECLVAVADRADVEAQALGVPGLDHREGPDPPVVDREDLRAVRAPHHVRGVRHDRPVVLFRRGLRHAIRREQLVLAYDAQDPLARDAHSTHDSKGAPRPCDGPRP